MTNTSLPLLSRTAEIPFHLLTAEMIQPTIDQALAIASAELAAIKEISGQRTFENTMRALDNLGLTLDFALGVISHLESVATTPEWREEYNAILPKVTEFKSKIVLDEGLWKAITSYGETPEARQLSGERLRYLTKVIDDFKRNGASLSPADKEKLSKINTELAEITNTFSQNVLDATNEFEFVTKNEDDLAGLPPSAREMGRAAAVAKGLEGWRFTLQGPSFIAIMTYADSRRVRELFYHAHSTRCTSGRFDNVKLLYRILELRRERAQILGFKDF